MTTATFNGVTLAESDATVMVEGNHYFPPDSIRWEHFAKTEHHTRCPWKGDASYYTISAGDLTEENAAWTYEAPLDAAAEIRDHVAFYPTVTVA